LWELIATSHHTAINYQQYIEGIYGQSTEGTEDGGDQTDAQNQSGEQITGKDGDGIDLGRKQQDPDNTNLGNTGKSESIPATGIRNDS
jgi:hypothetical protein